MIYICLTITIIAYLGLIFFPQKGNLISLFMGGCLLTLNIGLYYFSEQDVNFFNMYFGLQLPVLSLGIEILFMIFLPFFVVTMLNAGNQEKGSGQVSFMAILCMLLTMSSLAFNNLITFYLFLELISVAFLYLNGMIYYKERRSFFYFYICVSILLMFIDLGAIIWLISTCFQTVDLKLITYEVIQSLVDPEGMTSVRAAGLVPVGILIGVIVLRFLCLPFIYNKYQNKHSRSQNLLQLMFIYTNVVLTSYLFTSFFQKHINHYIVNHYNALIFLFLITVMLIAVVFNKLKTLQDYLLSFMFVIVSLCLLIVVLISSYNPKVVYFLTVDLIIVLGGISIFNQIICSRIKDVSLSQVVGLGKVMPLLQKFLFIYILMVLCSPVSLGNIIKIQSIYILMDSPSNLFFIVVYIIIPSLLLLLYRILTRSKTDLDNIVLIKDINTREMATIGIITLSQIVMGFVYFNRLSF